MVDLGNKVSQRGEVRHATRGTPAGEGHEGIGVPTVCQCTVDRP